MIADSGGGVRLIDRSVQTALRETGRFETPRTACISIAIDNGLAIARTNDGLSVVDVTAPAAPREVAFHRWTGPAHGLALANGYAYVAADAMGLKVIDLRVPTAPLELTVLDTPGTAYGVTVEGGLAFVADRTAGLQVIDISVPAVPRLLGSRDTPGNAYAVAIAGNVAYVADGSSGLQVLDVSDPTQPTILGALSGLGFATAVTSAGTYAFVADVNGGLHVVDATTPAAPRLIVSVDTPGSTSSVALQGNLALLADGTGGLRVVDVGDPTGPVDLGAIDTPGIAADVATVGDLAYVADGAGGLLVVEVNPPPPTPTPSPSPSPTATLTAIPSGPAWPVVELVGDIRNLLSIYYNQEADVGLPDRLLRPLTEADKGQAAKDPDTLWETIGAMRDRGGADADSRSGPSPACHAAASASAFIDCVGARLALSVGRSYAGGLSLFRPATSGVEAYYPNDTVLRLAGQYALYHAFARDFDAPLTGSYQPTVGRQPRDAKLYHERMIRAYESHMRNILLGMLTASRDDASFQASLTRNAGWLLIPYVRTLQALEEYQAWSDGAHRHAAVALVNAFNQRIWWEWVIPQPDGPRTAGLARFGSQRTFDEALKRDPGQVGADRFLYFGREFKSLRP
ncbi:MAG TPA: hypothetical protein PLZ56_15385, partial [Anaerolineae bacterium]|nr:hypothetical protein [Anaerolineae bacterium]